MLALIDGDPLEYDRLFSYNPDTGKVIRKITTSSRAVKGSVLDPRPNAAGYLRVSVKGLNIYLHRLAWYLHYGEIPEGLIDHINGDKADNRIENLRDCDHRVNQLNLGGPRGENSSGYLGVSFHGARGKYRARIKVHGKEIFLGYFDNPEDGWEAYKNYKAKLPEKLERCVC